MHQHFLGYIVWNFCSDKLHIYLVMPVKARGSGNYASPCIGLYYGHESNKTLDSQFGLHVTFAANMLSETLLAVMSSVRFAGDWGRALTGWGLEDDGLNGDRKYWSGGVDLGNIPVIYHTFIRVFWAIKFPKSSGQPGHLPGPHWGSLQRSPDTLAVSEFRNALGHLAH